MDRNLARFILGYYVDMYQLLQRLNLHPRDVSNMMCPFHHNTNTPAAKMYKDAYGWCLWCFSERKMYTTYDVYEKLMNADPMKMAQIIWDKLPETEQKHIRDIVGSQEDFEGDVPFMNDLDLFSQGKISYKRLCDMIALKL